MISFNQFVECMRKEMVKKFQGRLAMKAEKIKKNNGVAVASLLLSCKLDAPAPCRLDAPDFDVARWGSADCLHQHQQVI